MFYDYYLKFANDNEAKSVLYTERPDQLDSDGVTVLPAPYFEANYPNIDMIGIIYKPTGNMVLAGDGIEYPEMKPIDGWHVNVRSTEPCPELEAYAVVPSAPVRVWG